ncbi:MAG: hypothetical protein S0880_08905 [Actinomycetota bacterium]|nr:hypothetical protein [Actinomycetota bacterium]
MTRAASDAGVTGSTDARYDVDIDGLLDAMRHHWIAVHDLPFRAATDMRDELADDLADARADGHTTAAVLGDDLVGFADAWAQARGPAVPWWRRPLQVAGAFVVSFPLWCNAFALDQDTWKPDVSLVAFGLLSLPVIVFATVEMRGWASPLRPAMRNAFTATNHARASAALLLVSAVAVLGLIEIFDIDGWAITAPAPITIVGRAMLLAAFGWGWATRLRRWHRKRAGR